VLLGLVGRLVPQIPFFFVGRPLEIGLGFLVFMLSLLAIATRFQEHISGLFSAFWTG
jgi:flagellar biosynthesis protein FliR